MIPLLFLLPTMGYALTLGNISVRSALNEPFDAVIRLPMSSGYNLDSARVRIAPNADFTRAGLERVSVVSDLRFRIQRGRGGKPSVRVTSIAPIRDPILEFLVELISRDGRMVRQYTVLLDPPELPADFRASSPVKAPQVAARRSGNIGRSPTRKPAGRRVSVAAPIASGGSYGPTRRNETAWDVARRTRPDSAVSMNQMMMALLRANPQAFANNNVNNLKSGVMLRVPGQGEIASLSKAQANNDFQRQYRDWKAGVSSAPPPTVERQVVSDAVRADLARVKVPPPATESGELVLVSPSPEDTKTTGVDGADAAGSLEQGVPGGLGQPGAGEESIDALRRQRDLAQEQAHTVTQKAGELRNRTDELEQRIQSLEKALQLRDQDLAAMQQRVGQETPVVGDEGVADGDGEDSSAPPAAALDREPLVAEPSLQSMLEDNWELAAGALALLVLGGGGLLLARRRGKGEDDQDEDAGAEEPRMVTGDVLTEVNQYLVLGRPQQAEERLKQEMASHPERLDLSLKLLEVYSRSGNKEAFDALAAEVFTRMGRDAGRSDWQRIAGMGRRLSPANPLYAPVSTEDVAGQAPPMGGVQGVAPGDSAGQAGEPVTATVPAGVPTGMGASAALGGAAAVAAAALPSEQEAGLPNIEDEGLAFDELEQELRRLEAEIGATVAEGQSDPAVDSSLDGFSLPDSQPAAAKTTVADDLDSMDFDLSFDDLEKLEGSDAGSVSSTDSALDDGSLDFDWGSDDDSKPDIEQGGDEISLDLPDVGKPASTGDDMSLSFDNDSFDLGGAEAVHGGPPQDGGLPGGLPGAEEVIDLGALDDATSGVADMEELTTKLDLARAYVDMDDKASAIDILDEVLRDASGTLREEADALKKQLG
jgi:pilus assembly protein FimV